MIGEYGIYRPVSEDTVVLDGKLPIDAGFSVGNRYSFALEKNGVMQMFPHVNAGGYQRRTSSLQGMVYLIRSLAGR